MSVLAELDDMLTPRQGRSAYIADALRMRWSNAATIQDAKDSELLAVLVNRGVITMETYRLIIASA